MKKSKKKKTIGDLIWRVVFLAALAVFCYCAFQLITIYLEYKKGTDEYSSLEQKYVSEDMFTENETGGAAGGENRGETDKNGAPVSSQADASGAENDSEGETAKDKTDLEKEPCTTGTVLHPGKQPAFDQHPLGNDHSVCNVHLQYDHLSYLHEQQYSG